MKNILILLLAVSLTFSNAPKAEELTDNDDVVAEVQEDETKTNEADVSKEAVIDEINISSGQAESVIDKSLATTKVNLPACDNAELVELAKDYITSYFRSSKNEGTLYRRYKHFILANIDQFAEDNIANYKTAKARPVSDIIADIKVNQGLNDANIRICKNQSKNHIAGRMYMIIYPQEINVFQVRLINLTPYKNENEITGFVFTDESSI